MVRSAKMAFPHMPHAPELSLERPSEIASVIDRGRSVIQRPKFGELFGVHGCANPRLKRAHHLGLFT